MPLQSATPVVLAFARYFARPACSQCGETQLAPEQSEFVRDGLIHHFWACDTCGHEFRTSVELNRDAA
jgi:hypothetical protein